MTRKILFRVHRKLLWVFFNRFFFIFFCFLFESCQSKLNQEEYVKWITDYKNQLHVKKTFSDFIFDLQYQPSEYIWLQRANTYASLSELPKTKVLSGDIQYYILKIGTKQSTDLTGHNMVSITEKQHKEYYLSYRFQNDITLEDSDHVLPCVLYHSEGRTEGDGGRTFVLGFENPVKDSEEAKIVIRSELFSSLPIRIKVAKKTPTLEL
jgi:hypothetical protein